MVEHLLCIWTSAKSSSKVENKDRSQLLFSHNSAEIETQPSFGLQFGPKLAISLLDNNSQSSKLCSSLHIRNRQAKRINID